MADSTINLPGYEIVERLGEGGMAVVWLARQVSLDRMVAIKILSPSLVRDEEARRQFSVEAQTAARLKHPGIVQVYDAGEHEDVVYIVMELVSGCTVGELLAKKKRISEKHALLIAEGIALALGYAWIQSRLIHCDIKPDNVLIDEDGSVKLADMGLARFIGIAASGEARGMIEGTPHYTSPEQVRGDPDLDCRSDIYSLGAMLYHLVTGVMPFHDSEGVAAMERQVTDYLQDPTEINHTLSHGMATLIEKMMVKDRTLRYQTWEDVQADLGRLNDEETPLARLPAGGQSTVLRSEARALAMTGRFRARPRTDDAPAPIKETAVTPPSDPANGREAEGKNARSGGKQKIVLPKDLREQIRNKGRKTGPDFARAVSTLVLMTFVVLIVYGSLVGYHFTRNRADEVDDGYWEDEAAAHSALPKVTKLAPARAVRAGPARAAEPARAPVASDAAVRWKHPTFLKGARLFNDALEKYTAFQKDKKNPEILKTVEQQCREAIRAFEFVKPFAPEDVKIKELIDQCYHLISDCRHSSLIAPAPGAKKTEPVSPLAAPAPAYTPPPQAPGEADDLALAPNWNGPQSGGDRIVADLEALLSRQGVANIDLKADTSMILYGQVFYLMPVREAARILNQPMSPRKRLNTPGFPKDSFFFHTMKGNFGDGFDEIHLVTDATDRIVAVQLLNAHPDDGLWLDAPLFEDRWHAFNFIEMKTKGNSKWRVGHKAEMQGRVLKIDTELRAGDPNGYFGLGDSKERVTLYLPEQMVNLILYRVASLVKK